MGQATSLSRYELTEVSSVGCELRDRKTSTMKLRVVHERRAMDLMMMETEPLSNLRRSCIEVFSIAPGRLEIWLGETLLTQPDATPLRDLGVFDGSVFNVTVSAPVIAKKAAPATPLEALEREEKGCNETKTELDGYMEQATCVWKESLPSVEEMDHVQQRVKLLDELLTQSLIRLDNIETGAVLRERRRALLKMIQALQDGSVLCIQESIKAYTAMIAKGEDGSPKL